MQVKICKACHEKINELESCISIGNVKGIINYHLSCFQRLYVLNPSLKYQIPKTQTSKQKYLQVAWDWLIEPFIAGFVGIAIIAFVVVVGALLVLEVEMLNSTKIVQTVDPLVLSVGILFILTTWLMGFAIQQRFFNSPVSWNPFYVTDETDESDDNTDNVTSGFENNNE